MPPQLLIFDLGGVIVAHDNVLLWRRLASLTPHAKADSTAPAIGNAMRGSGIGHWSTSFR